MTIAFLLAYFITWGWILAITTAVIAGYIIKRTIYKRLDDYCDEHSINKTK